MESIEWKKFLIPYEHAVEELKVKFKSIRNELRTIGEYSPIEFVTGRVKKVSSILEKARKLSVSPEEISEKIEDIAGIRIMCQFVEDIYTVVDYIRDRDGEDLEIVLEKDYITNFKDSGYRSYHLVIKYPIHTALGPKNILAEIQIRTLAMNFWAIIEHSLKYKYKQQIPNHIEDRLKKAADAAFKLDQEMSEIRHEIRQAQKFFEVRSNIVSSILQNIQSLYLSGRLKEANDFQERFNRLWEKEDTMELKILHKEIDKLTQKYETYE
ncbi:GTP pyrophosphokinase [Clostridium formicaceticum]|uniref:GTP pyrophosphokinase n=1 Tax=Clostridium formicaceticum TaxID=1497 RepID=A0AAC9RR64_9CLOT|nr:GTP pyrophosphokinase family protein [Clostridium formicaceticum]AOY78496.1 GTP pyrophosphokinase [Clostridium formicaceticum]ARE88745.1 GTP pyrophosphokinase YjbM [Clostridium formicaceticum]